MQNKYTPHFIEEIIYSRSWISETALQYCLPVAAQRHNIIICFDVSARPPARTRVIQRLSAQINVTSSASPRPLYRADVRCRVESPYIQLLIVLNTDCLPYSTTDTEIHQSNILVWLLISANSFICLSDLYSFYNFFFLLAFPLFSCLISKLKTRFCARKSTFLFWLSRSLIAHA